ncbi:hypothetical protein LTR36_005493 [Oleoguttula mirabilis]|uniref:F-box domain-containing protein n=1 Tax=Oleoguttula mirabilis TaxID=1507867 RepID=A0AAV9JFB7_9PEZI|nr:hypothetical protein LTR36_005493 [Oleoguttula mirabilis]
METARRYLFGPTAEEQKRKCNALVRSNTRKLDRDLANLKSLEHKTRNFILQASKRAQRNPSQAQQARAETRIFAKELIRVRRQEQRLATSKATLASVGMQVNEAFAMRKIEGSIKNSTGIMKDVNSLVRLPELMGTMRELSQELVKAGIIEEMVSDTLDNDELLEDDEEAETEVDKVLSEVLKDRVQTPAAQVPMEPVGPAPAQPDAEEDEMDSEEMLAQMRGRLEALKMAAVIYTPELLERILLHLHAKPVLLSQRVCRYFHASIANSIQLRRSLYLEPALRSAGRTSGPELHINPLFDCYSLRIGRHHTFGFVTYTDTDSTYNLAFVFTAKLNSPHYTDMMHQDQSSWQTMMLTHSTQALQIRYIFSEAGDTWRQAIKMTLPSSFTMGQICGVLFAQRRKALWDVPVVAEQRREKTTSSQRWWRSMKRGGKGVRRPAGTGLLRGRS